MDPALVAAVTSSESAQRLLDVLRNWRSTPNTEAPEAEAERPVVDPYAVDATARAELSDTLKRYYERVVRRADVSFYAAVVAAVAGLAIIAIGVWLGVRASSSTSLAVVTTAAGVLSQITGLLFFKNRTEERSLMASVLKDLREDRSQDVRTLNSLILIGQIVSEPMKDNLTAAVALQMAGCTVELEKVKDLTRVSGAAGPVTASASPSGEPIVPSRSSL